MINRRIETHIGALIRKAIPFVLLRPPGLPPHLIIQEGPLIEPADFSTDGFYFHPFSSEEDSNSFHIQADHVLDLSTDVDWPILPDYSYTLPAYTEPKQEYILDKETYLSVIRKGVELIKEGAVNKVVLSRVIEEELEDFNAWPIFKNLGKKFPTACVYLVNIPGESIWFGASPEKLVDYSNGEYQTIALAGTLASKPDLKWGQKEIEEHAVVANFIQDRLEKMGIPYQKEEVYTRDLGTISHLAQDFHFQVNSPTQLNQLIKAFHPGPAISGFPKEKAIQLIYELEPHERAFYTGYFGYQLGKLSSSWINIRCAKYVNDHLYVYVGGGIMKDSDPEKEWVETELKSRAILDVMKENLSERFTFGHAKNNG